MGNPYAVFVQGLVDLHDRAKALPLGGLAARPAPAVEPGAPTVLVFSPHPDDECIVGGLPLRLLRESRARVVNVAVTQGSNRARRDERWAELADACGYLGFELVQTRPGGLERIHRKTREDDPEHWAGCVQVVRDILDEQRPAIVLLPHDNDWNSTHIGTHWLVRDAVRATDLQPWCVETEYWGALGDPNLMVEVSPSDLADLLGALSFHIGEVRRNPYHLSLPAWMQDNVRRGGELVGGQGGAPPDFLFATLYRVRLWRNGGWQAAWEGGRLLPAVEDPLAFLS